MDDDPEPGSEQPPVSGNRWEPTTPDAPYVPAETSAVPPSRPTWWTRARAGVAGGAAAVLLAGGLGGFAIGRATAGQDEGPAGRQGVPTGFDGDGDHGFQNGPGGPGGPQLGQPPDDGQVPGMQAPDDGQQDDGTDGATT